MLPFEQTDPKRNLVTELSGQRETTRHVSRPRQSKAFGFLITFTNESKGQGGLKNGAIEVEVRLPPTCIFGGRLYLW